MSPSRNQNQHFISKFLTKHWEHPKRKLRFFNFDTNAIEEASAKALFAESDLWPEKCETIFNGLFESRLSNETERLISKSRGEVTLSWREYRAYTLLLIFHAFRMKRLKVGDRFVEHLADLNEKQLDTVVKNHAEDFSIVRLPTEKDDRLFFPDTAFFGIPILLQSEEWLFGSVLPIAPNCALGVLPKNYDRDWLASVVSTKGLMRLYSVGLDGTRKIVVHPNDFLKHDQEIRSEILRLRATNNVGGWRIVRDGKIYHVIDIIKKRLQETGTTDPNGRGRTRN